MKKIIFLFVAVCLIQSVHSRESMNNAELRHQADMWKMIVDTQTKIFESQYDIPFNTTTQNEQNNLQVSNNRTDFFKPNNIIIYIKSLIEVIQNRSKTQTKMFNKWTDVIKS